MLLDQSDINALILSLKLAFLSSILLLLVGAPLAWYLSRSKRKWIAPINALITLPLVLPPSVIGFYLLIAMSPTGFLGQMTQSLGLENLAFSFEGLVIASIIYSLPFAVQPLQNAFNLIEQKTLDAAASLRMSPMQCFFKIVIPMTKSAFISAFILCFAHVIGEFGIILMIGGSIEGETKVISVQIYEQVEALEFARAHSLSIIMVIFAFIALTALSFFQKSPMLGGFKR